MFGEASEMARATIAFVASFQDAYQPQWARPARSSVCSSRLTPRFVRNQAGIPAVVCGPGDLDQAHVIDESVSIERLVDAAALYAEVYASFGA